MDHSYTDHTDIPISRTYSKDLVSKFQITGELENKDRDKEENLFQWKNKLIF